MRGLEEVNELVNVVANSSIVRCKEQGKPVVGYACSYAPEEVFYAAGAVPFRIRACGCRATTLVEKFVTPNTCSFARSCLELALQGQYRFLDGLVYANTCDIMRRMVDIWKSKVDVPFTHFLSVPHRASDKAVEWYKEELSRLIETLSKALGITVTEEALEKSIRVCNETRALLRKVYELGKMDSPPLKGSQMQAIAMMACSVPAEERNQLLNRILSEVDGKQGTGDHTARVMILGGVDNSSFTEIVEGEGAAVVAEASCYGTLTFWEPMVSTGHPLDDIARYYLERLSCPRMPNREDRWLEHVKQMVADFRADGVILERLRYCNNWSGLAQCMERGLRKLDIPLLILDREYLPASVGAVRTRVQAFMEMLGG